MVQMRYSSHYQTLNQHTHTRTHNLPLHACIETPTHTDLEARFTDPTAAHMDP